MSRISPKYLATLISPKVLAAAGGAGLGAVLSKFIIWLIGAWLLGVGFSADQQDAAIAAVPDVVVGLLAALMAVGGALIPGYVVTDPARDQGGAVEPLAVDPPAAVSDEPAASNPPDAEPDAPAEPDEPDKVNGIRRSDEISSMAT